MIRILILTLFASLILAQSVNIVIIFHMHQPWYIDLERGELTLPWVRMHAVANYLKVPLIINETGAPMAYTLTGSLIEQLNWYANGTYTDVWFKISEKLARGEELTIEEKYSMLQIPGGFFDINWQNILYRHPRYTALLGVRNDAFSKCPPLDMQCVVSRFSDQDFLDLATLFNLMWIDPYIAKIEGLWGLRNKTSFSREDLDKVLKTHLKIIKEVLPLYEKLSLQNRAELVAVPYSHPLMPLLADMGLIEDLKIHIDLSNQLFVKYLSTLPSGVWPPELAINDDVLKLFIDSGYLWTVLDEDVLKLSGGGTHYGLYYVEHQGRRLYILFRDKTMSDNLGFRYASTSPKDAVEDFVQYIKKIPRDECSVLVMALDGENPWENYQNFGVDFLKEFFTKLIELEKSGEVKLWKPTDFIKKCRDKAQPLQSRPYQYFDLTVDISFYRSITELPKRTVFGHIAEGSWAGGGGLDVWIGDVDENVWWMWLRKAREDVGVVDKWDVLFPLLIAEASDWPFWYGGEWGSPKTFDPLAKAALRVLYKNAGLKSPSYLDTVAYPGGSPPHVVSTGWGRVEIFGGPILEANTTHLRQIGGTCGVVYISNPNVPRSPYIRKGAVYGLNREKLAIYADMAYDTCSGIVYLTDGEKYIAVGNEARLSFINAAPGDRLYVEYRGLVYILELPEAPRIQRLLLISEDSTGDDYGPGTYQYPKNPVFKPGVFDLQKFELYDMGDFLRFVFRVRELGGNPWGGPAGFSLQFFHVYINRGGGFRNDTLGLRVQLCEEAQWDAALLIGPGWKGGNKIVLPNLEIDDAMSIKVVNNTIIADVPKRYLGEFNASWKITVFLTSWDGYGHDNIRNFGVIAEEWTVGGADPVAVLAGVAPRVFDLLAPTVEKQTSELRSYQAMRLPNGTYVGRLAVVCSYVGRVEEAREQLTITHTLVLESTATVEKTTTVRIREVDVGVVAILLIAAAVLTLAAYYAGSKKKQSI